MKTFIRILKKEFWCGKGCGLSFRLLLYTIYMSIVMAYKASKPLPFMSILLTIYVNLICGNIGEVYDKPNKFKNKLFRGLRNASFEISYKLVDYDLYSNYEWNNLLRKHPDLETFYSKRTELCRKLSEIACDDLRWNNDTLEKFWYWCERNNNIKKRNRKNGKK